MSLSRENLRWTQYREITGIATVWLHLRHFTKILGVSNGNDFMAGPE